jgi:hypothetical protein
VFSGKQAWAVLAGGVVLYEVLCDEDELLSVVVDRWLESRPVVTRLAIGAVALHLLNLLPPYADPLAKRTWKGLIRCLETLTNSPTSSAGPCSIRTSGSPRRR